MSDDQTDQTLPFSSSTVPRTAEAVIIGGMIVGASTALFLAKAGIHPVLLESAPDLGTRTTAVSAHCIRAQFSSASRRTFG